MADKAAPIMRTTARSSFNETMLDLACLAVYRASMRKRRILSLRATVVEGLDCIIHLSQFDRFMLLKRLSREKLAGNIVISLLIDPDERKLLHEVKALLQNQSLTKLNIPQTVTLALLSLLKD